MFTQRNQRIFKVLCIIFIFVLLILIDQYLNKTLNYEKNRTVGMLCPDNYTIYGYCKEKKIQVKNLDTNKSIKIYIDKNKIEYDFNRGPFKIADSDFVIIGDSMIQADEINISQRMAQSLRDKSYQAIEIGYSSWSPYQYERLPVKYSFSEGTTFFVFLFWNDFSSNYNMSYFQTYKKYGNSYPKKNNEIATKFKTLSIYFIEHSFVIRGLFDIYNNLNKIEDHNKKTQVVIKNNHNKTNYLDCSYLDQLEPDTLIYDIISFSKDASCWSKLLNVSVDQTVESLNRFNKKIPLNSRVFYFLAPAGWAFKNENTIGRNNEWFSIANDISVSQIGLKNRLKEDFAIIDLEEILKSKKDKNQSDLFYFAKDGHWTENSHKIIGKTLLDIIKYKSDI